MADLKSKSLIVAKGILFLAMAIIAAVVLLMGNFSLLNVVLILILCWSAARFYYFLFYVIHHYVDPRFNYAGIFSMAMRLVRQYRKGGEDKK